MQDIKGEWILRYLSHKGINYGGVGGGVPTMSLGGALRAFSANECKGFEFDYVDAYYNNWSDERIAKMSAMAYEWASGFAAKESWRLIKGKETIRFCVMSAIKDNLQLKRVWCKECRATGINGRGGACKHCADVRINESGSEIGNGLRKQKAKFYYEELEISKTQWNDRWKDYHKTLKQELNNIFISSVREAGQAVDITREYELLDAV
ncbi:MAG: hypothetical protein JKY93_01800 [Gammaproteobacteria bacterium]|nr:hypothetical protein [Gammaproteobacteria bacterium]